MFFLSLPLIGHLHLLSTNHSDKLHSGLKVLLECYSVIQKVFLIASLFTFSIHDRIEFKPKSQPEACLIMISWNSNFGWLLAFQAYR